MKTHVEEKVPIEFNNCLRGIEQILISAWEIANNNTLRMIIAVTAIITAITKVIVDIKGTNCCYRFSFWIVLGEYITNISKYLFTARTYYLN